MVDSVAAYSTELAASARDAGAQTALALDAQWADLAAESIRRLASSGRPFSADDLRWTISDPPSAGAIGAAFLVARKSGIITFAGWTTSRRVVAHGRGLRLWRGVAS